MCVCCKAKLFLNWETVKSVEDVVLLQFLLLLIVPCMSLYMSSLYILATCLCLQYIFPLSVMSFHIFFIFCLCYHALTVSLHSSSYPSYPLYIRSVSICSGPMFPCHHHVCLCPLILSNMSPSFVAYHKAKVTYEGWILP